MAYCIPKDIVVKLLRGAKSGDLEIYKLYQMDSESRRNAFARYTSPSLAKDINASFEQAMASTQRNALTAWVQSTFTGKNQKKRTDVVDKIIALKDIGLLTPEAETNFLQDLVGHKLGLTISAEEAKEIHDRAVKLQAEFNKPKDKFGLPPTSYFAEKKQMDNYLKSLNPTHALKVLSSTIGRGNLLLSVKSPLTNIVGNTVNAIEQSFERRLSNKMYSGKVDKNVIHEFLKRAGEIYNAGQFDVSRADSYSDGSKTLGEQITHSQGKGIIRWFGRIHEDFVFNTLLSKPDVWFAHRVFADSANLFATRIAQEEGLKGDELRERATQLFMEAASPVATTPEGMLVREQAKAEAMFATFQNDSTASEISLGVRKLINKATGDLSLGDQIMPFVKTPANVAAMSLDSAGLGFIRGTAKIMKGAIGEYRSGNPKPLREALRLYIRSGFGMLGAYLLANIIDPDDFVGMYPTNPSEQELLKAKNGNGNMIRVGGKWISLDYFGFLGGAMVGMLYARKYGKDLPSAIYSYLAGATIQAAQIPGIEESKNLASSLFALKPNEYDSLQEKTLKPLVSLVDQIRARVVPGASLLNDLAKAFDTVEREVDPTSATDKFKAAIPGSMFRGSLPEKKDVFGEIIKGEPWYSVILFGSRVKTARENEVIAEVTRLDEAGYVPSLTRPEKTSTRVQELKQQIGETKFAQAMDYFRTQYYKDTAQKIKSGKYRKLSDEEKRDELNKIKDEALEKMLTKYHYKKPKKS